MYFNYDSLTLSQLNQLFFEAPQVEQVLITPKVSRVILNNLSSNIQIVLSDNCYQQYKINFYNKNNIKFLRLKIFELDTPEIYNQFIALKNKIDNKELVTLEEIQQKIQENKLNFSDISFSNYNSYLKESELYASNAKGQLYRLIYNFSFPVKDENNLKFGYFAYIDIKKFCEQYNISETSLDKRVLINKLLIADVKNDNEQTKLEYIDGHYTKYDNSQAKEILNPAFSFFTDLRTFKKTLFGSMTALNNAFSDVLKSKQKILSAIDPLKTAIDPSPYFSNPLFTRDTLGNLNILVHFDYKNIFKNYLKFKNSYVDGKEKSFLPINYIKIVKRQCKIDQNYGGGIKIYKDTVKDVVTGNISKNLGLIESDNVSAQIKEVLDIFPQYLSLEIIDRDCYPTNTYYQYGIQINFSNVFYNFLKIISQNISDNLSLLDKNPININDVKANIYPSFFACLRYLNIIKNDEEQKTIEKEIQTLLTSNKQDVIYCKSVFEKLCTIINSILDTKKISTNSVEYWFDNIIDASINPTVGYEYFEKSQEGLLRIDNSILENKMNSDLEVYVSNKTIENDYRFIAPNKIYGKNISANNINDFENKFTNLFSDVQLLNLKNKLFIDKNISNNPIQSYEYLLNNSSYKIYNLYNNLNDDKVANNVEINSQINTKNLNLITIKEKFKIQDVTNIENTQIQKQFFSKIQKKYNIKNINNIEYMPKILFMHNTIKELYVLDNLDNLKNPIWKEFTQDYIKNLRKNKNKVYLVKTVLYQDNVYAKNFEQIKLPFYDEYFLLSLQERNNNTRKEEKKKEKREEQSNLTPSYSDSETASNTTQPTQQEPQTITLQQQKEFDQKFVNKSVSDIDENLLIEEMKNAIIFKWIDDSGSGKYIPPTGILVQYTYDKLANEVIKRKKFLESTFEVIVKAKYLRNKNFVEYSRMNSAKLDILKEAREVQQAKYTSDTQTVGGSSAEASFEQQAYTTSQPYSYYKEAEKQANKKRNLKLAFQDKQ